MKLLKQVIRLDLCVGSKQSDRRQGQIKKIKIIIIMINVLADINASNFTGEVILQSCLTGLGSF